MRLSKLISLRVLSILLVVSMTSACAIRLPVTYDYDPQFSFVALKSYAWVEPKEPHISTLNDRRQRLAIDNELKRKGYLLSTLDKADFWLKAETITDKKVDIDRFNQTWGYNPFFRSIFLHPGIHHVGVGVEVTTSVREYEIGTLVLDAVDPKQKQVIWRGTVSRPLGLYKNRTPEEWTQIAAVNAEQLLASFPPDRMKQAD